MTTTLFDRLCQYLNVRPDRRGEAPLVCPSCGKDPQDGECSFSVRGWHCFVCGAGGESLRWLARLVGLDDAGEYEPPERYVERKPSRRYWWQDNRSATLRRLTFHSVDDRLRIWQERYSRNITRRMVEDYHLGYGKLPLMATYDGGYRPASRCQHDRLLVPLFDFDGKLVGVRARALDCQCGKWLSPAGNRSTLYNWQALTPGCLVMIVENPIDALLATELTEAVGLATLSISNWEDGWTRYIERIQPAGVIIAYDNHWPAMGTHLPEWMANPKHKKLKPRAQVLRRELSGRGLPVTLWEWDQDDPVGCDMGEVLR